MTGKIGRIGILSALALTVVLPQTVSATTAAPANDNFANATQIAFFPFEDSYVDTTTASDEPNELGCGSPEATVWYRLQPRQTYSVRFRAIAHNGIDLVLNLYEGTSLETLNGLVCADDTASGDRETLIDAVHAGHTYYLQVGGYNGMVGEFTVRARRVANPANDNFAGAISVAMGSVSSMSTLTATVEADESFGGCGYNVDQTVWYRYTPTRTRTVVANTVGSDFDTVLTVWTGTDLLSLEQVTCNDDRGDLLSRVKFTMQAGVTYYFQIGGYGGSSGNLTFNFRKA
jgi:hypothetical protein